MLKVTSVVALSVAVLISPASAQEPCEKGTKDHVVGRITEIGGWKDDTDKPRTAVFRIEQSKGKCVVKHIVGPDKAGCVVGATITADGWASFGSFGSVEDSEEEMLHADSFTCK